MSLRSTLRENPSMGIVPLTPWTHASRRSGEGENTLLLQKPRVEAFVGKSFDFESEKEFFFLSWNAVLLQNLDLQSLGTSPPLRGGKRTYYQSGQQPVGPQYHLVQGHLRRLGPDHVHGLQTCQWPITFKGRCIVHKTLIRCPVIYFKKNVL